MLDLIIEKISVGLVTFGVALSSLFGIQNFNQNVGGTYITPDVRALFSTTLASKISSTATEMTLSSATDKNGNTLASSTYGFIIDEGTSVEEFVLADCTGTACTNMTRGISVSTGTTSVSTARFEHRRGASVKITTAPSLVFAMNVLKGRQNIENVLRYDSSVSTTTIDDDNRNLVNYELLAYTAFNGASVINSSATQKGVVELATQIETASSTVNGSAGVLAIPASNATSTYNAATAPLRVVVTKNDGKIDTNFINLASYSGTSNIASTTIYATTTSGTWVKPSNLRYVIVELVGGGGGSGGSTNANFVSGAGGGGGYAKKVIPASALGATETVNIGAGGSAGAGSTNSAGGNGGTTSFGSHVSATGGTGGLASAGFQIASVAGGTGVNGDYIEAGEPSGPGLVIDSATASNDVLISAKGGDSKFGYGGVSVTNSTVTDTPANVGTGYGAGASGNVNQSLADINGAAGTAGYILFTYVFF